MKKTKDLSDKFINDINKKVKAFTYIVNHELKSNEKDITKLNSLVHKLWSSVTALRKILKEKDEEYKKLQEMYDELKEHYELLDNIYYSLREENKALKKKKEGFFSKWLK